MFEAVFDCRNVKFGTLTAVATPAALLVMIKLHRESVYKHPEAQWDFDLLPPTALPFVSQCCSSAGYQKWLKKTSTYRGMNMDFECTSLARFTWCTVKMYSPLLTHAMQPLCSAHEPGYWLDINLDMFLMIVGRRRRKDTKRTCKPRTFHRHTTVLREWLCP